MPARRRLLLPALFLMLGAASPAAAAGDAALPTEPLAWQCDGTGTLDVETIPPSLTIGGQPATFTAVDANTVTVDAPSPAFASGPDYEVRRQGDRQVGHYRDGCFSPLPRLRDESPGIAPAERTGPIEGGNAVMVKVFGALDRSAQLYFDGVPGANPSAMKSSIVCPGMVPSCGEPGNFWWVSAEAPPGTAGWVDLSVVSGDQRYWGQTAASNDYRYLAPPAIHSVTPARGPLAGGNVVNVDVDGAPIPDSAVTIGGAPATIRWTLPSFDVYDGTYGMQRSTTIVPAGVKPGTVDVVVTASGDPTRRAVGKTPAADDYTYEPPPPPAPGIATIGGGPGFANLGGLLIVRGSNFGGLRSLEVGPRRAPILSASGTIIVAFAPPLAKGAYPVTVTTRGGSSTATAKYVYRSLF